MKFSGFRWLVKNGQRVGPGPNYFSDSELNVAVAADGLHLRIDRRDGRWYTAEVIADRSLGYGVYTFRLVSRVDVLDSQAVFAGFLYENDSREIDIEFSRVLATPNNAQFVVQPYTRSGNLRRFDMGGARNTSHRIVWRPDSIEFVSWVGHTPEPDRANTIQSWIYRGPDIPPPGRERMRFNLWLFRGDPPVTGREDEVVIRSFDFRRGSGPEEAP